MPVNSVAEAVPVKVNVRLVPEQVLREVPQGLYHTMAMVMLIIWYVSSGATLFLNKYILSHLSGDALVLGISQLVVSLISSYIQMEITSRIYSQTQRSLAMIKHVYRDMLFIGAFRCVTVILGLIALKHIAVSFVATIKASSPLFTVLISRIMLGERTSFRTKVSMIPVTLGLCLCSSFELSFEIFGFLCALGTNVGECLQNVCSKVLMSGEHYRYTVIELQFWASLLACIFQLPFLYYYVDIPSTSKSTSTNLFLLYLLNGLFYHLQSVSAFAVMTYISPITHSVVNTVKRALLIWLSVVIFGNPVTFFSGFGTLLVIIGVVLYNERKEGERNGGGVNKTVEDAMNG